LFTSGSGAGPTDLCGPVAHRSASVGGQIVERHAEVSGVLGDQAHGGPDCRGWDDCRVGARGAQRQAGDAQHASAGCRRAAGVRPSCTSSRPPPYQAGRCWCGGRRGFSRGARRQRVLGGSRGARQPDLVGDQAGGWRPAGGEQVQRVAVASFEFVKQALAYARDVGAGGARGHVEQREVAVPSGQTQLQRSGAQEITRRWVAATHRALNGATSG
jgi:hypothetical protein